MAKLTTMYVIFARRQQHGRSGTLYTANDGSQTHLKSHAARFSSFSDAQEFAKKKKIELTALTYIGQKNFTEFEIQHRD
jgi:hypothetical protein